MARIRRDFTPTDILVVEKYGESAPLINLQALSRTAIASTVARSRSGRTNFSDSTLHYAHYSGISWDYFLHHELQPHTYHPPEQPAVFLEKLYLLLCSWKESEGIVAKLI